MAQAASAPDGSGATARGGRSPRAAERGLTLIELMVSIAIIILMAGVAILGVSSIRGADVGTTANVLSGAMRYVASLAVTSTRDDDAARGGAVPLP